MNLSGYYFFFSSRRRHTRFSRDWSSDVCSSDLTALHRIVWSYIGCCPCLSSIKRICNVEMPDTTETVCRPISTRRRAIEGDGGTASVGCHCRRIKHVLQFISRAHVIDVVPSRAVVVRCSDNCLRASASSTGHYKIDPAVIINANLRVL